MKKYIICFLSVLILISFVWGIHYDSSIDRSYIVTIGPSDTHLDNTDIHKAIIPAVQHVIAQVSVLLKKTMPQFKVISSHREESIFMRGLRIHECCEIPFLFVFWEWIQKMMDLGFLQTVHNISLPSFGIPDGQFGDSLRFLRGVPAMVTSMTGPSLFDSLGYEFITEIFDKLLSKNSIIPYLRYYPNVITIHLQCHRQVALYGDIADTKDICLKKFCQWILNLFKKRMLSLLFGKHISLAFWVFKQYRKRQGEFITYQARVNQINNKTFNRWSFWVSRYTFHCPKRFWFYWIPLP